VAENAGYGYNGDNNDEGGLGFGTNPPIIICKLLNKKMNAFTYYNNSMDAVMGNPRVEIDYYNFMKGNYRNGTCIKYGGNGVSGTTCTNFMFDNGSNPATKSLPVWNEKTGGNQSGDRRFVMSAALPELKQDSSIDIEFAYIFVHDPNTDLFNNFDKKPKQAMRMIQNWYDASSFPSCAQMDLAIRQQAKKVQQTVNIYPNPGSNAIRLSSDILNSDITSVRLMDYSGKTLYSNDNLGVDGALDIEIDISSLNSGVYIIHIETSAGTLAYKVVKI
jgi:hypothetical protein